ncbi:HAD-superfamily hydrolase, subfamily IA, variant 3 [Kribbella flavida DSM 17836]|uniref:HAD-superfamily hydrolase, subfamily IA, variant 3 n=1 Tax=Kribbella flavida (strain DSM 17836 / JCM 10339 / NBRC 14399) TaxID=479435 RepID=D2Q4T9_KRIFD|nr:HAD family phosphatase [Kribbella flavida]ADB34194.1 HAD-superfamily hydrolase, subfamily IA, variant 3 [Kribbella flavida DSM 17836]
MTAPIPRPHPRGETLPTSVTDAVQVLLCDADGNLFPSEEPAFAASAQVTNRFLTGLGVTGALSAEQLRRATTGMTFRRTALALAAEHGVHEVPDLEAWVDEEKRVVTAHLQRTLTPDRSVIDPLTELGRHLVLAAVSSSALTRLHTCLAATGLNELIRTELVFSAEDSLATPTSKPDPAIYRYACERLGIEPAAGLAVEDSVPGVRSAVAAGCPTIGNVVFVPAAERAQRIAALHDAGVLTVVSSWNELADLLLPALGHRAATAEVPVR